jgi:hypothetical protein
VSEESTALFYRFYNGICDMTSVEPILSFHSERTEGLRKAGVGHDFTGYRRTSRFIRAGAGLKQFALIGRCITKGFLIFLPLQNVSSYSEKSHSQKVPNAPISPKWETHYRQGKLQASRSV